MIKPFIPIPKTEAQTRANGVAQRVCVKCPFDYPVCQKCIWYYIMNELIGEQLTLKECKP